MFSSVLFFCRKLTGTRHADGIRAKAPLITTGDNVRGPVKVGTIFKLYIVDSDL